MNSLDKYGNWACVAGAGEGLGKAFARALAQRGFKLILIDVKEELIGKLKSEFHEDAIFILADLGDGDSVELIMSSIIKTRCRFLIYNAAYGPVKPFLSNSTAEIDRYLDVNIRTQLHLIFRFVELYKEQKAGVLMISSLAGFRGTRFVIPYAATKAFIWNMAEGLHYELQGTNLNFSVCVPGTTNTPNFKSTNPKITGLMPNPQGPEKVAEDALNRFGKRLFIIPGLFNKISHFLLNRVLPRTISSKIHNQAMKKMYEDNFMKK